ncbi:hypothetical protein ONV78_06155 [Hahella sp. CR1]|uniref:sulfotransferase family protein n=1 Tax=Hahella sp. CR1 TaxID=2992807 RepID=UPI002442C7D7|nr:hypothetical protein [Hahella sp. CR1]MDG9667316.1 hypothetical protein [Hahella sp. CR1]
MRKVIFILGMHRSGTSALAGALRCLGLYLGDDFIEPIAGVNEKGFWEHKKLVDINERLLARVNKTWYSVVGLLEVDWTSSLFDDIKKESLDFVKEVFGEEEVFALKDPRLCLLLPFWLDVMSELDISPAAIIINRSPVEVARSLNRRDGIPQSLSEALWIIYSSSMLISTKNMPVAFIDFDDLLLAPVRSFLSLQSVLGVRLNIDGTGWRDYLDANLRHHKNTEDKVVFPFGGELYSHLSNYSMKSDVNKSFLLDDLYRGVNIEHILDGQAELFLRYNREVIANQELSARLSSAEEKYSYLLSMLRQQKLLLDKIEGLE